MGSEGVAMQVSLVMFKADGTRRDFPLTRERVVIGRKNNCDLRIPLSSVSRQHCEIRLEDERIKLRDLGSSNGTYHNSIRVQEAELAAGDEVVIGPVVFTVVVDGEPAEVKPIRSMMGDEAGGDETQVEGPTSISTGPDHALMPDVEPEMQSPTVDLDDPIAALERLAEAERSGGTSGGEIDFDFDLDDEESEKA